ncbi:MAG TPA: UPF0182 family protein [Anaerolineae bacterium]|nr:UPF0182 family protein [Anaerolineae bacterium]HQI83742.1 UPF0182 family protein [Anaerolineae bacterium]
MTKIPRNTRKIQLWISLGMMLLFLLCITSSTFATFYTDFLWFKSLDYTTIFTTRLLASLGLTLSAALIAVGFLLLNWSFLPHWIAPKEYFTTHVTLNGTRRTANTPPATYSTRPVRLFFSGAAIFAGLIVALTFNGLWRIYLLANNGVPFNIADPVFHQDVSFYIFTLPWLEALLLRAKILVALTFLGVIGRYAVFGQIKSNAAIAHISVLGALWMLLIGLGWLLNRYGLLQAETGVVFGAGYTDINARMPLYVIQAVIFFVAAGILILNVFIRRWRFLVVIGVFWLALSALGPGYPAAIQQFTVEPNEFILEKPYIEHNIRYTRYAYGLDNITEQTYPATGEITAQDLETNRDILGNVRLWDYRPLLRTYGQLQEIRLYYSFNEVDVDRYTIDGQLRQVMLAAREINVDELADQAKTWINQHLIFTHGYGLTLNYVNEVTREGLPNLIVRDIPPISQAAELRIERPQIYFGELTSNYVVINAKEDEFDYPQGDSNVYTRYTGPDGVALGSFLRRALLATRFGSTQLLLSPALNRNSRILFHRTIQERAQTIAPMLWFDEDPYPVIAETADGVTGIVWLLDAYTWTDHFPYSEPVGGVNYMRNSVKVTIDAYTGATTFYLIDPSDPIAATYARIFPDLFQPGDAMPQVLREHWRYPETLFLYQSRLYATYHMRDPQVFYNREDLWDIPQELVETTQQTMEPYYVIMRVPDSDRLEFVLIRPYTPKQKQNMIAWLYADCDGNDYGELGIVKLSKDRLVYGPMQIEARADQDPLISQQLSLWNQRGSRVLRGNLLVIPVEDTFLFVEPLYLEAESGQLPELKRIIVAYDDRVVMAETLDEALLQVLNGGGVATGAPSASTPEGNLESLAAQAWERYQAAQACLETGDWTCYGREQAALEAILRAMVGSGE